jgi:hypothetical protein
LGYYALMLLEIHYNLKGKRDLLYYISIGDQLAAATAAAV